ncbi:hypothetical protein C7M84_005299 [Penaeus vannamei]|uniref:Uncharacterized protein n=1 Tax=Penaeus vannamei TaxID=6689 RepID=A0A423TI39_PENVA|nr:hypothetical protein C7M84_005299 [Penaeus vannamei]
MGRGGGRSRVRRRRGHGEARRRKAPGEGAGTRERDAGAAREMEVERLRGEGREGTTGARSTEKKKDWRAGARERGQIRQTGPDKEKESGRHGMQQAIDRHVPGRREPDRQSGPSVRATHGPYSPPADDRWFRSFFFPPLPSLDGPIEPPSPPFRTPPCSPHPSCLSSVPVIISTNVKCGFREKQPVLSFGSTLTQQAGRAPSAVTSVCLSVSRLHTHALSLQLLLSFCPLRLRLPVLFLLFPSLGRSPPHCHPVLLLVSRSPTSRVTCLFSCLFSSPSPVTVCVTSLSLLAPLICHLVCFLPLCVLPSRCHLFCLYASRLRPHGAVTCWSSWPLSFPPSPVTLFVFLPLSSSPSPVHLFCFCLSAVTSRCSLFAFVSVSLHWSTVFCFGLRSVPSVCLLPSVCR